ncbi:hypothetical protein DFJ43DRAFT_258966 [Lentinula guzmanii]|uniref:Uncharacterized protein n=1 Tax=Lentinula guzmanii TaxID=2804957 RepID=A0AA38N4T7_9AGAR|nr:hypothetical protein DFJ43DRAFT_258966 [Lentinula guzmanii]
MDIKGSRTEKHTCGTYLTGDDADLAVLWFWHKLDGGTFSGGLSKRGLREYDCCSLFLVHLGSFIRPQLRVLSLQRGRLRCSRCISNSLLPPRQPGFSDNVVCVGKWSFDGSWCQSRTSSCWNRDSAFLRSNTAKTRLGILPHFFRLFFTALVCFQTHLLFSAQMYGFL